MGRFGRLNRFDGWGALDGQSAEKKTPPKSCLLQTVTDRCRFNAAFANVKRRNPCAEDGCAGFEGLMPVQDRVIALLGDNDRQVNNPSVTVDSIVLPMRFGKLPSTTGPIQRCQLMMQLLPWRPQFTTLILKTSLLPKDAGPPPFRGGHSSAKF